MTEGQLIEALPGTITDTNGEEYSLVISKEWQQVYDVFYQNKVRRNLKFLLGHWSDYSPSPHKELWKALAYVYVQLVKEKLMLELPHLSVEHLVKAFRKEGLNL